MPRDGVIRAASLATTLLLLAAVGGCGDEGVRRAASDRAASPPAVEPAGGGLVARGLPRVAYRGGPFLRRPRIVTITFEGDGLRLVSRLERFGETITRSGWWQTVTEGYCTKSLGCIGKGRPGRHRRLPQPLPAKVHDVEVGALLQRQAKAGKLGPLDPETLLVVYLPKGVALADAFVARYCDGGPRALHRALRLERATVPYAVMPRCGGEAELTASASQEILEAATNPDPAARGFAFEQSSANLGFTAAGVEPVDPCGLLSGGDNRVAAGGFAVARAWSNRAAARGQDPCVPAPVGRAYPALVPRRPTVRLANTGDSAIIELDARADRPVPGWDISAFDLSGRQAHQRYLDVSLDKSKVAAGQTVKLTITARKRNPNELSLVALRSTLDGHSYTWPVAVVMR